MEQNDITEIYETLAPMAGDYANAQAEQIGMAQQSMGPLAAQTMGTTTSALGNYTYNRLMRPQVDVMRDEIMVQGYANQLNRLLSDRLNEARNRYNRSGSSGAGTTSTSSVNLDTEKQYTDDTSGDGKSEQAKKKEKEVDTVSTVPSTAKEGEYNVGTATIVTQNPNDENNYIWDTRIVTKDKDGKYHIQGVGSYRGGSKEWEDAKKKYHVQLNNYPGSSVVTTF